MVAKHLMGFIGRAWLHKKLLLSFNDLLNVQFNVMIDRYLCVSQTKNGTLQSMLNISKRLNFSLNRYACIFIRIIVSLKRIQVDFNWPLYHNQRKEKFMQHLSYKFYVRFLPALCFSLTL